MIVLPFELMKTPATPTAPIVLPLKRRRRRRLALAYAVTVLLPLAVALVLLVPRLRDHPSAPWHGSAPTVVDVGTRLLALAAVVILAAYAAGALAARLGQPRVVGEILAGLCLGPSLLGAVAPQVAAWLMPAALMPAVTALAEFGLVMFIFSVGREAQRHAIRGRGGVAVALAHSSISVACAGGIGLGLLLYPRWAGANVGLVAFALFMGCALAITAFPVLARILRERGMQHDRIGVLSLLSAAVADITAWFLLAVAIALAHGRASSGVLVTVVLTAVFAALMLGPVKRLLRMLFARLERRRDGAMLVPALLVAGLLGSAYVTSVIGISAIFGAFVYGLVVPDDLRLLRPAAEKMDDVSAAVLLPFFFLGTGLRVDLWHARLDGVLAAVLLVAVVGKTVGPIVVARLARFGWRESLGLGALLNTRGLTELVVLNIGLSMGIIGGPLFAVLVLMAVITTMMTGPALNLLRLGAGGRRPHAIGA
jgi:Kef-type K+ transport system membrane component KefB